MLRGLLLRRTLCRLQTPATASWRRSACWRLVDEREDWGGGLVLCCGEGCAAGGVPAAVSIAGGATLAIDGDAGAVKAAMRRGEIDFVVNTLDEALRALKNEVRQRGPLSVGLIADVSAALREMVERGVPPDLLMIGANQNADVVLQDESIRTFQASGMPLLPMVNAEEADRHGKHAPHRENYLPRRTRSSCERWMSDCWRFFLSTIWFADAGFSVCRSICARRAVVADGYG